MKITTNMQGNIFLILIVLLPLGACDKLLEKPSDKSLAVISTLDDCQAIIDRPDKSTSSYPGAGEDASDDYYLTNSNYNALTSDYYQRFYQWNPDHIFEEASNGNDWYWNYFAIYGENSVLAALNDIPDKNSDRGHYIKGQALFWRGFRIFEATQIWTLHYDEATASSDLGMPLRLDPDFNAISVRSNLSETYTQIFSDLKASIPLLITNPVSSVRASRQGAYGVLARAYLAVRNYEQAALYADSCLQLNSTLLDFNELSAGDTYPIKSYNKEAILWASGTAKIAKPTIAKVNPLVYAMYAESDLRKNIFYTQNTDGSYRFRGSFVGSSSLFRGIATGEMLLIRAEGYARKGEIAKAMTDLNSLLRSRWDKQVPFEPYAADSKDEALRLVLEERRKELTMRGLRWMDIRRLNKEGANIIQTRIINGQIYTLPPNDPRYAMAIPEDVIALSGMQQNPR